MSALAQSWVVQQVLQRLVGRAGPVLQAVLRRDRVIIGAILLLTVTLGWQMLQARQRAMRERSVDQMVVEYKARPDANAVIAAAAVQAAPVVPVVQDVVAAAPVVQEAAAPASAPVAPSASEGSAVKEAKTLFGEGSFDKAVALLQPSHEVGAEALRGLIDEFTSAYARGMENYRGKHAADALVLLQSARGLALTVVGPQSVVVKQVSSAMAERQR